MKSKLKLLSSIILAGVIIGCSPSENPVSSSSSSSKPLVEDEFKSLEERCAELGGKLVYDENGLVVDKHFGLELEGCR